MPDLAFEDARIESCDLQLGDTWRGTQGKMSVTAPVKKIRKKSDNKPQSQINKCHNEKRRRELENETINQLEELLGTCLAEVKQPDKNGIVREATRQIQEVLKRRRECPSECPLRIAQSLSPVQAGEVSSTQPQPPPVGLQYTELTTLIEALKHYTGTLGWVLLEINSKGEIECVTENIRELIDQDRTELYKKSIFSIVHPSDHAKLRPLLRNIQSFGWGSGDIEKFHAIQAHLIQNPNGIDGAGYVEVLIHAAPVRGPSSEEAGSVMCVIRRCEDASAALLPVDGGPPAITANHSDNIVFRLDCSFTVLSCDLSGLENINSTSLVGTRYLELVESSDRLRVETHLQKAVCHPAPPAISAPFRLRIAPDRPWIRVSARSRLFRAKPTSHEPDFIMSTHTVLSDDDVNLLETNAAQLPVGGPLMTSVANGESSTCDTRFRHSMSPADPQFSINEGFEIDGWSFSLDDMSGEESKERKDSTSEGPPTPLTPRTPTTPGDVPPVSAGSEEPNRLRSLLSKKLTPTGEAATNSNNRILKDLLKQEDEEATSGETSAPHTPHTPLTPHTPHTPHTPASALSPLHTAQAQAHPHPRPPPHPPHPPHAPHTSHAPHQPYPPSAQHSLHQTHHNNSDMLLRVILNEKSDDDAVDSRRNSSDSGRGTSQPSALLTQLLSSSNGPSSNGRSQDGNDNYLERIAGVKRKFEEAKGAATNAKRATPETQQVTSSAASAASSAPSSTATSPATTSSTGMSPLCQKNQILVSLLARQQTTPTTPLPLPNPILRPYGPGPRPRHPQPPPQRMHATLSNMLATHSRSSNVNGGTGVVSTAATAVAGSAECSTATAGLSAQSQLQMVLQGGARGAYPPPPAPPPHASPALHYANTAPHHMYNNQPPGSTRPQGGSGGGGGDNEIPSDQALSDILDEVIENMPDADRPPPDVGVLLELESNQQLRLDYSGMKEKNALSAINAIRQSLMQFENSSKSPVCSSPGTPPVYPVQSPGSCNMGSGSGAGGSLYTLGTRGETPTDTARARALVEQHRARLLQMQRSQQMLVPPEAAEQPQSDLGSTINALVSGTPPNVSLARTDYRHLYHPSNQMGSNYGTNKIPSSQQNPMLSRQLSGPGGGGYAHGTSVAAHPAAALHTPLTSQPPYHRQPRPQLVGGYYEDGGASGGGYCGEYARRSGHAPHSALPPHPPHPPPHDPALSCTGSGSGVVSGVGGVGGGATSEYVRNELRAVVGARSARPDMHPHPTLQPPDIDPLMAFDMSTPEYYGSGLGGGGVGGGR